MRNFIAYSVMIVPLLGYNIYCFMTREPNSEIDWKQVFIASIIAGIFYNIGLKIKNKGKIE
jgi:hypothetical protein